MKKITNTKLYHKLQLIWNIITEHPVMYMVGVTLPTNIERSIFDHTNPDNGVFSTEDDKALFVDCYFVFKE